MKCMGLDLGSRTLGIATSDALGWIASSLTTIRFEDDDYETALEKLLPLIKEHRIETIVLGLPKHMNGDIGIRGEISLQFKEMIESQCDVPVVLWDERLTTVAAQKLLIANDVSRKKRKKIIDQMAAVQILQGYLDSKK